MAVLTIPLRPNEPHYSFQITLEGVLYTLRFRWNERAAGWFMSILDASEQAVLMNRRIVLGFPLTARFRYPKLPPGEFEAIDTTNKGVEPALEDFGTRVLLLYHEQESLPSEFTSA